MDFGTLKKRMDDIEQFNEELQAVSPNLFYRITNRNKFARYMMDEGINKGTCLMENYFQFKHKKAWDLTFKREFVGFNFRSPRGHRINHFFVLEWNLLNVEGREEIFLTIYDNSNGIEKRMIFKDWWYGNLYKKNPRRIDMKKLGFDKTTKNEKKVKAKVIQKCMKKLNKDLMKVGETKQHHDVAVFWFQAFKKIKYE